MSAIERISAVIGQTNDFQLTIASAVEEQTATTNEMSRSVEEAAQGSASSPAWPPSCARRSPVSPTDLGLITQRD